MLVHIFHITADFGVLVFFLPFLYFLLSDKNMPAIVFGTLMVLSKEIGIALYVIPVFLMLISSPIRRSASQFGPGLLRKAQLLIPVIIFVATVYTVNVVEGRRMHWSVRRALPRLGSLLLDFDILRENYLLYAADIFVLSFNWLMSIVILACLCLCLVRLSLGMKARRIEGVNDRRIVFFLILFAGVLYALTRYRPCNFVRYLMTAYPLLIIVYYYALLCVCRKPVVRKIVLSATLALIVCSNFRTIDPLSKFLFGTFDFGHRKCLLMGRLFGKEHMNRNSFVYNLEFLQLHYLQNMAFSDLRLQPASPLLSTKKANLHNPGLIDRRNSMRTTIGHSDAFAFRFIYNPKWPGRRLAKKAEFFYLHFPNLPDAKLLNSIRARYRQTGVRIYDRDGYQLHLYRFVNSSLRSSAD